jgi:hypothetical protein
MVSLCLASLTTVAFAQGAEPAVPASEPAAAPQPPSEPAVIAPAPAPVSSGGSLRNGFSLSAGQELGDRGGMSISGQLFGVDWRIGAKINETLAVYVDSHLSLGTVSGAESGLTGNFAAAVIGEYTLPMRLFVGGGGGYGVLNNPNGPLAQARVGYYPFEKKSDGKSRRLNVAFDARFYFVGEPYSTFSHFALSVGYDRF